MPISWRKIFRDRQDGPFEHSSFDSKKVMANKEHVDRLKNDIANWNRWRIDECISAVDLNGADLRGVEVKAPGGALDFDGAYFKEANLSGAFFGNMKLAGADFTGANLRGAQFIECEFTKTLFAGAIFDRSIMFLNIFADVDLSDALGLDQVRLRGPSTIGLDTIFRSKGQIPHSFLEGCGVPDEFITQMPAIVGSLQAIQFDSCFISYSHADEDFAKRLSSRMKQEGLRVWFAPEELKGGQKLYDQIDHAIHYHDRLLVVLSEDSLKSNWVKTEIRRARRAEMRQGRRKLFPIKLVDFDTLRDWEYFDADTGTDLAVELREYFMPDFSRWKEHDEFESAFNSLLRDLKAVEGSDD